MSWPSSPGSIATPESNKADDFSDVDEETYFGDESGDTTIDARYSDDNGSNSGDETEDESEESEDETEEESDPDVAEGFFKDQFPADEDKQAERAKVNCLFLDGE